MTESNVHIGNIDAKSVVLLLKQKNTIMKKTLFYSLLIVLAVMASACGGKTDVVDSGTYEGTVKEVEADKTEIYVETSDKKTLELYFNEETKLTQNGAEVPFSTLAEGQKVEVTVEKVGKRLDPKSVKILE
jgi:CspA family cold shock protein